MATQNTTGLNETFDLLAHPHRRYVLYHLSDELEVDVETLAAVISNWDGGPTATGRSGSTDAVETVLRHAHLPKLADAGLVTFDADAGSVELAGTTEHGELIDEAARIDGYAQTAADD